LESAAKKVATLKGLLGHGLDITFDHALALGEPTVPLAMFDGFDYSQ
jgi:hypothetical protein